MAKRIACIVVLLTLLIQCSGCTNEQKNKGPIKYEASQIQLLDRGKGTVMATLSDEHVQYLLSIWNDGEWSEGLLKFSPQYIFEFNGTQVAFSWNPAVFLDYENNRSLELTEEQGVFINTEMIGFSLVQLRTKWSPLTVADLEEAKRLLYEKNYYKQVFLTQFPGETDADAILAQDEILAYEQMIEDIKDRGYIPMVKCNCSQNAEITFNPAVKWAGAHGIKTDCTCNGGKVAYYIYFLEEGIPKDWTIKDYWKHHTGESYSSPYSKTYYIEITRGSQYVTARYCGDNPKNGYEITFLSDGYRIRIVCSPDLPIEELAEKFDYITVPITKES